MSDHCVFCRIIEGSEPASLVLEDALTLAFVDLRQYHPGHVLVVPRAHLSDVRDLDDATGAALIRTLVRVTRAVGTVFENEGISIWHSIGPAAFQEVPHLHLHVHPRRSDDDVLRVYPQPPATPDRDTLETMAQRLRAELSRTAQAA